MKTFKSNLGVLCILNILTLQVAAGKASGDGIYNVDDYYGAPTNCGTKGTAPADTCAIQSAINAAKGSSGKVFIPVGTYNINATITVEDAANGGVNGLIIEGASRIGTVLNPSINGNVPILLLRNCRNCSVRELTIAGNQSAVPSSAIESRVTAPCFDDRSKCPVNLELHNLILGDPAFGSPAGTNKVMDYGIRFTADSGQDVNNDQSIIQNVSIGRFITAGISIEHSNSLNHRIIGGRLLYGLAGVRLVGGSFQMSGTDIYLDDTTATDFRDFWFTLPSPNPNNVRYYHASMISDVGAEGKSRLLVTPIGCRVTPDPNTTCSLYVSIKGLTKKGSPPDGAKAAVFFESDGGLTISASRWELTPPVGSPPNGPLHFAAPKLLVNLENNLFFNLRRLEMLDGVLVSKGNWYGYGLPGSADCTLGLYGTAIFREHDDCSPLPAPRTCSP